VPLIRPHRKAILQLIIRELTKTEESGRVKTATNSVGSYEVVLRDGNLKTRVSCLNNFNRNETEQVCMSGHELQYRTTAK
jgi:hypothetical protein